MLPVVPSAALLKRELFTSLRRKRTFAALVFMIGSVFLIAIPVLLEIGHSLNYRANVDLEPFVAFLFYAFFTMACLLIPALAGVSVCMEKQQGSFDLLATSLVRPIGVVAAKMLNAVGVFVLVTIAAFPLLGVAFFFAGFEMRQVLTAFAIILSTAIACAAVGVLCSTYFYRATVALILSYLAMVALLGAPQWLLLGLAAAIGDSIAGFRGTGLYVALDAAFERIAKTSPLWCPVTGLSTTIVSLGGFFSTTCALLGPVVQLAFAAVCLSAAARIQRRPPKPQKVDSARPIDDQMVLELRRKRFPYYLIDPLKRVSEIRDGRNPMYVKEVRAGFFRKSTFRVRVFYVLAIVCFIISMLTLSQIGGSRNDELYGGVLMFEVAFVLLMVPPTVSTAVTREFELNNIDMLRITLLRPSQILFGKVYSCLMALAPVVLAMLLGNVVMYFFVRETEEILVVTGVYVTMAVSVLLAVSLSLFVSLLCRRQATALVGSYIANLVLFVGIPVVILFLWEIADEWFHVFRGNQEVLNWVINLIPSPMVAQLANYDDINKPWMLFRWAVNTQVSLGATVLLLTASITHFERYRMRER